jgi:hypothetical protein
MGLLKSARTILALILALPGASLAAPPEIPVPRSYHLWTITTGGGAGIVVGMIPQDVGGTLAICGAIWPVNEKRQGISTRDRVFREAIVEIRGKPVRANLNIFPAFDNQEAVQTFRCAVTNSPWQGPYKNGEFGVRLRNSMIRD